MLGQRKHTAFSDTPLPSAYSQLNSFSRSKYTFSTGQSAAAV